MWTVRDFKPLEIMFAPLSSQLRDTHLMAAGHAVVTLPKHGRGAHPDNASLALDGRGRTLRAPEGMLDTQKHEGYYYWMVDRCTKEQEPNMAFENATVEQSIRVGLPGPKKRKTTKVEWQVAEEPSYPIMVNPAEVLKHTKLRILQAEAKSPLKLRKLQQTNEAPEDLVEQHDPGTAPTS